MGEMVISDCHTHSDCEVVEFQIVLLRALKKWPTFTDSNTFRGRFPLDLAN